MCVCSLVDRKPADPAKMSVASRKATYKVRFMSTSMGYLGYMGCIFVYCVKVTGMDAHNFVCI